MRVNKTFYKFIIAFFSPIAFTHGLAHMKPHLSCSSKCVYIHSSSRVTNLSWCVNGEKGGRRSGQVSLKCERSTIMCGLACFPSLFFRCKPEGCGKAPFRAAECVYERFWSGMGTRNDEPGPGDHPASVTHTTPHRANQGATREREREKEQQQRALCARPNFLPC